MRFLNTRRETRCALCQRAAYSHGESESRDSPVSQRGCGRAAGAPVLRLGLGYMLYEEKNASNPCMTSTGSYKNFLNASFFATAEAWLTEAGSSQQLRHSASKFCLRVTSALQNGLEQPLGGLLHNKN